MCMNVLALDKRDHQQMFNGQRCQLRKYIWSLDWLVFSGISSALFKQSMIWTYMTIRVIQIVEPVIKMIQKRIIIFWKYVRNWLLLSSFIFLPVEVIAHWNFTHLFSKCRKPLNESEVWGISRAFRLLRRTFCFIQVLTKFFFPTENI